MRRNFSRGFLRAPLARKTMPKNWEHNVQRVGVEACDTAEDPLGLRAVFHIDPTSWNELQTASYTVGASLLTQRLSQLEKAGYKAPMTRQAIQIVEKRLGRKLIDFKIEAFSLTHTPDRASEEV